MNCHCVGNREELPLQASAKVVSEVSRKGGTGPGIYSVLDPTPYTMQDRKTS